MGFPKTHRIPGHIAMKHGDRCARHQAPVLREMQEDRVLIENRGSQRAAHRLARRAGSRDRAAP
jgi:hypothetical protein